MGHLKNKKTKKKNLPNVLVYEGGGHKYGEPSQMKTLVLFKNQFVVSPLMIRQPNPKTFEEY